MTAAVALFKREGRHRSHWRFRSDRETVDVRNVPGLNRGTRSALVSIPNVSFTTDSRLLAPTVWPDRLDRGVIRNGI